jgi:predicted CXXCH cytochrome family protein
MANDVSWEAPTSGGEVTGYFVLRAEGDTAAPSVVATLDASRRSYRDAVSEPGRHTYAIVALGDADSNGAAVESTPSASASNDIVRMRTQVGAAGGLLRAANGEIELDIPAGAYTASMTVSVAETESVDMPPNLLRLAGVYDLEPSGPLAAPATLRIRCDLDVEHFQIAGTVLAAAELVTFEPGSGTWVPGVTDATVAAGWLEGTLSHFSYWSGASIQPHGTTPSKTSYCSGICHNLVAAPGSPQVIPSSDPSVCFFCHGNESSTDPPAGASGPNIEAAFLGCDDQTYDPANHSRHPSATSTADYIACTTCHDPHRDPGSYAGLLRVYDAVTGRAVRSGDAFCFACHGTRKNTRVDAAVSGYWTRSGGNMKGGWTGNAHATSIGATGTSQSACMACHEEHGSTNGSLIRTEIDGAAVTDNDSTFTRDNSVCEACHSAAVRSYPGIADFDTGVHWPGGCEACHDPHGNPGVPSLMSAAEEDSCYACHSGGSGGPCNVCHGTPDIASEIAKTLPNPISWARHDAWSDATANVVLRTQAGDVDDDGDQDFVTGWNDRGVRFHENTAGDASAWSTLLVGTFPVGSEIRSVELGDLEGDGDLDVLVAGMDTSGSPRDGFVRVFVNTAGDGSAWTERVVRDYNGTFSFYGETSAAFGDFDRDGDLDVASGWWTTDTRWHENQNGDGTAWGDVQVATSFYESYRIAVGDVTGDGYADILNGTRNGPVRVYRNDSAGASWTYVGNAAVAEDVHDIAVGDLDGDEDEDLVVTSWGQAAVVKLNTAGDGTTWSSTSLPKYWDLFNVAVGIADLDGDSTLDVVASAGAAVYQYDNEAGDASTWTGAYAYLGGGSDYGAYNDVDPADMDGDGDPDLCTGGTLSGTGRKAFWLENLGVLAPTSGAHPVEMYSGRHAANEAPGSEGAGNRHAECVDCHAPHTTLDGVHTMGSGSLAGVLQGTRGVMAVYGPTAWTPPTYYDDGGALEVAEEYELCFRCHSSYTTGYTGGDKGLEFNWRNAGTHPVVRYGANLGIWDSAFTLGTPWNPTAGDDADYSASSPKVTCTDCHGNDDASGPAGPHGSIYPHLLQAKVSTSSTELGGGQNDLCVICHDPSTYNVSDGSFPTFNKPAGYASRVYHRHFLAWGAYCLECHEEHGSNDPHMVTVGYNHTPTGGAITEFSMCSISCHPGSYDSTYTVEY